MKPASEERADRGWAEAQIGGQHSLGVELTGVSADQAKTNGQAGGVALTRSRSWRV